MRSHFARLIFAGLLTILLVGSVFGKLPAAQAQTLQYWSDPVNISNSGSSTDPKMVVDSDGVIHVTWIDAIDGYQYAESADGKVWTAPAKANFPFSAKDDSRPDFFASTDGLVYIVWRDKKNALHVGQAQSKYLGSSSSWANASIIANSGVVAYDAIVDSQGALQLSYVTVGGPTTPAGVYYVRVGRGVSSRTVNIYASEYFRSLDSTSGHVRIAVPTGDNANTIYIAWDDRPQKRIFLTKSMDGGLTWDQSSQVVGPDAVTGLSMPFNINIGAVDNQLLLTWQIGQPGGLCADYSEWSLAGDGQFSQPVKISENSAVCSRAGDFVWMSKDFAVASFNVLDSISLVAWDGSGWSDPQPQSEIAAFINPMTLDSIILGCQSTSVHATTLYIIGCDKGSGGDIWFSSRSLGAVADWFPPSSTWGAPTQVTSIGQAISDLTSAADTENMIHAFWIQAPSADGSQDTTAVEYARWNKNSWSSPVPIISQTGELPTQLSAKADEQGRLLLAWVDGKTGTVFFSWANDQRANNPGEWQTPEPIPSVSQANSSPRIVTDASGRIVIAYAVPINEQRGIYVVESGDGGKTWTQPSRAFDASSAGWDIVDQPDISLTGDGRLHLLFRRYSSYAEQRQSLGIYYSQSADGGATWSAPEAVSQDPVLWGEIVGYGRSTVHRLWQQEKQSTLVTLDQISQDGGQTWGRSTTVSSLEAASSLTTLSTDQAGNLDLLQLQSSDTHVIQHARWDGSTWTKQAAKEVYVKDRGVPFSITANTSSQGELVVSVSVSYLYLPGGARNDILSVGKSLELPAVIPTAYPAVLPVVKPIGTTIGATPGLLPLATKNSPAAGLTDSPSFLSGRRNVVGLVLLGGILVLIVAMFRPTSTKQRRPKGTPK